MNNDKNINEEKTKKEKLLQWIRHNKPLVELATFIAAVIAIVISIVSLEQAQASLNQTQELWEKSELSSSEQHTKTMNLNKDYNLKDHDIKRQLNEIELQQETAIHRIGTILEKSTAITERIAESNRHQADIANRMIAQSEANIEITGEAMSLPKSYLDESGHNEYAPDSTVVMFVLMINNKSSEPIDILASACKLSDDSVVGRSVCAADSVKDANGNIFNFISLEKLYDDLENDELEPLNEFIKQAVGDYYANTREYPLSFHMIPFEEKIGFLLFHIDTVYHPEEFPIELGIRTNRGIFREKFIVSPIKINKSNIGTAIGAAGA